jgi:hypothetical protein
MQINNVTQCNVKMYCTLAFRWPKKKKKWKETFLAHQSYNTIKRYIFTVQNKITKLFWMDLQYFRRVYVFHYNRVHGVSNKKAVNSNCVQYPPVRARVLSYTVTTTSIRPLKYKYLYVVQWRTEVLQAWVGNVFPNPNLSALN